MSYPAWMYSTPDESDCPKCGKDSCDGTCLSTEEQALAVMGDGQPLIKMREVKR